jgi:hypothetical protein
VQSSLRDGERRGSGSKAQGKRQLTRARAFLLCLWCATLAAAQPNGESRDAEHVYARGVEQLERGAVDDAIDTFESLADRGFVHPDASFNRANAYVLRARSASKKAGDLGRAVAALEETLVLRPKDADAEHALDRVRAEIARRRAREGAEPVVTKTSLSRAVVGLLGENTWALIAAFGSVLLALGLAARIYNSRPRVKLGGVTAAGIGGILLLTCGGLAAAARHYRETSWPAVVIVTDARFVDEGGVPIRQKDGFPEHVSLPEGTSVFFLGRRGELSEVEWGTYRSFVNSAQIRVLARP